MFARINRATACALGEKFFDGPTCKRGHRKARYYVRRPYLCSKCKSESDRKYNRSPLGVAAQQASEMKRPSSWQRQNREKRLAYKREYRKRSHVLAQQAEYCANRRLVDDQYRIASALRARISSAVKKGQKGGSAVRDLGCSISDFKAYIEAQFVPGMSWDNWSFETWHLDHILPLASFDLTNRQQFLQAAYYTNYQPLWAFENLSKGAKLAA